MYEELLTLLSENDLRLEEFALPEPENDSEKEEDK